MCVLTMPDFDHRLVTANVVAAQQKVKVRYTWRNIKAVDLINFERILRQSELFSRPEGTADGFVNQLIIVTNTVLDELAPLRSAVRRQQKASSGWLSSAAIAAKCERRRLEQRWLTTRDETDRVAYRKSCRTTNKLINQSRSDHFKQRLA
jgi:hypothetical protein